MPLQIRRGNTAEVNSITPLVGELIYNTQTGRVLVGDGGTAGGLPIAGVSINEAKDAAAASILAGTHKNISFSYDSVTKALSATVDILTHETIVSDAIVTDKIFNTASTVVIDVDTATVNGTLIGSVKGSVFADDSTLLVDAIDGVLRGTLVGTVAGNVLGNVLGNVSGNVTGNTTGYHTGDVKGSVFADDSTQLVDAVMGRIVGPVFSNVTGIVTGTAGSSLIGNTNGFHTGDVKGSIFADDSSVIVDANDSRLSAQEGIIQNIETSTIDGLSGGSIRMQGNNINIVTAGTAIFGNGNEDINSNIYVNRTVFTGTSLGGVTVNTSHGFSNDMDGLNFRRTRGPSSAPTTIQQFDVLGKIAFWGYNGTDYKETMQIINSADTINSTAVTSVLAIQAMNSSGNLVPRLRLVTDGRLLLGPALSTDSPTESAGLEIYNTAYVSSANSAGHPLIIRQFFDSVDSNNFTIVRTRGTRTTPTTLLAGDKLFEITCLGHDGTSTFRLSSRITFSTNGPITSGAVPGVISFDTQDTTGTMRQCVQVREDGVLYPLFGVTGDLTGSVFSDSSTKLIDGTSGSLMMANINMLGQTGNLPATPGSVDSWLEVTVNGNTKYIPLYA